MTPTIERGGAVQARVAWTVCSCLLALLTMAPPARSQSARRAAPLPVVSYTLRVDSADTTGFTMEMRVRSAPDTFRLAMVRHPEYDDRFWRTMSDLRVEGRDGPGSATRVDSALWSISARGGQATIRWRVGVPAEGEVRASWRPFLRRTGALVGGPHSFLYIVGAERAPANVALELPSSWEIATGLTPTTDPRRFRADDVEMLVDSPILTGNLRSWWFAVDDTPHRVAYWPLPNATPFDTALFLRAVSGIAREAIAMFGGAPYHDYTFLVQDGAYGGLEHANSVTGGAESRRLAAGMANDLENLTHEYFHTWNLVRIHPVGRGGPPTYVPNGATRGLWFSEGLTIFYTDLLARRAGAPTRDSTRRAHVERLLARYFFDPGDTAIAPERASLAEYAGPGTVGDYDPSPHTQGEVIGTMLDLLIREATGDRRTIDDLMRVMMQRFSGDSGFTSRGVERAVADVCGCNATPFFARWVRGAGAIDVNRYLRAIGYRADVTHVPAMTAEGAPVPDFRLFASSDSPAEPLHLILTDPRSIWGRAGLHTNDQLVALNGQPMREAGDFRRTLRALRIGDTARVAVLRRGQRVVATVPIGGFDRVVVRLVELPDATPQQLARRARWATGR
ncbi:MAG TPA: PDZ domain-containing protein [Gemmatimonadaceae bacterium]|nr:PDZ domain-containing protein [Gemmatimonadaceae bacterium]